MAADPTKKLRIATIYSYGANEAEPDGMSLLLLAGKRWSGVLSVRECDTGMKL